jgi:TonB-dependent SusC/RagA subfamily outer membrane receptor
MSPLFAYLLKASATVFILWVFYFLCLRRMTFHQLNRYFFITGMMVSFLWPALPLEDWFFKAPQISQVVYIPVSAFMFQFKPETPTFGIEQFLKICYFGGMLFMLIRLGIQILSLRNIFKRSEEQIIQDVTVRVVNEKINPFSFFGQIFLNPANHTATELRAIIQHEKVHNHQAHSIDILLSELTKIVLWFNPFSWLFCKVVKENIEFEVDRILLHQGIDCKAYQYSLLKLSTIKNQNPITNHFNLSNLKIRIIMMNKKKSSRYGLATYALVIPVLLFSMAISVAFAQNKLSGKKSDPAGLTTVLKDSLSGKKPLIIFDGKIINKKTMDQISPDDILTVDILKDDSAEKIYGEKAKDGVILIRSKLEAKKALDQKQYDEKLSDEALAKVNPELPSAPYYIIDGVPADKNTLQNLNPDRIESISVLKDKSATSLYGDKGKNGVILVTTKKGSINVGTTNNSPAASTVRIRSTNGSSGEGSSSSDVFAGSKLNDVVVVGYGNSTGHSVAVGDSGKMKISTKDVYILLDGVEIDDARLQTINPETILKMEVLKDKSATAVYGDKGKNGVILITTKKK